MWLANKKKTSAYFSIIKLDTQKLHIILKITRKGCYFEYFEFCRFQNGYICTFLFWIFLLAQPLCILNLFNTNFARSNPTLGPSVVKKWLKFYQVVAKLLPPPSFQMHVIIYEKSVRGLGIPINNFKLALTFLWPDCVLPQLLLLVEMTNKQINEAKICQVRCNIFLE